MSRAKSTSLDLTSPISALVKNRSKTVEQLAEVGINTLEDLLSIIPLHIDILPPPAPISTMQIDKLFQGVGKIINIQKKANYYRKGRGKSMLYNLQVYVEDFFPSNQTFRLQFFNVYHSVVQKIEKLDFIVYQGKVQQFKGQLQIINPIYHAFDNNSELITYQQIITTYPTINGIKPHLLKKLFDKLPDNFWTEIKEPLPTSLLAKHRLLPLDQTYKLLHGKITDFAPKQLELAKRRLIYAEFFHEQLKIFVRKSLVQQQTISPVIINNDQIEHFINLFPYSLTSGQRQAIDKLRQALLNNYPIMKLIQGDVGSGKTTVAIILALMIIQAKGQVAFMCPTESLAQQHYRTISVILAPLNISIELLTGSDKESTKQKKRAKLQDGSCQFVIGTHALIQDAVQFKKLQLAIIDEQHKFGVNQRIKLTMKGSGVHTVIMTATPIPRSLCLTLYGDLDIITIDTLPLNRKPIKTRIVTPHLFEKYLSFVLTRLSLHEQAYVVVPAIYENNEASYISLEKSIERFKTFFPNHRIGTLHGDLSPEEKNITLQKFVSHQIDILIATSVIEVGIDVPNATIMTVLSPERFGLSSLHQLRGRVGRGNKPGFCFLITDKNIAPDSMARLKIIEKSTNGFYIAEEDLKLRGEGALFGTEQSGSIANTKLGSLQFHYDLMEAARNDLLHEIEIGNPSILDKISQLQHNEHIIKTI